MCARRRGAEPAPGHVLGAHAAAQAARKAVRRFTLKAAQAKTKSHSTWASPRSFDLAEARDRFDPAEDPFDPRSTGLTLGAAVVPRGARVDGAPAWALHVLTDMGRDAERPRLGDEVAGVVVLVGPQGASGANAVRVYQLERRLALGHAPVARVATACTTRHSIRTWPRYASRASTPCDFRYKRASGSVFDACVSFFRTWPRKSRPSPSSSPSLR